MYVENPVIEVPDMFVHFLHPELYDKYLNLRGSEADQDPALKDLHCAHIFEKRFRLHIYTEFNGVIFAIPVTSTNRARHHVKIMSGRAEPSFLSFSCVLPIPPKYVPQGSVLDILAEDTRKVSENPMCSLVKICDTEFMNNRRVETYTAISSYVKSFQSSIQRNLICFLSDYAREINLTKEARALIHANSTMRYFEKDERVKKAFEYAYYMHYLVFPNKKDMVASLTKTEIKQFKDKYKIKKQYDKSHPARKEGEIDLRLDTTQSNNPNKRK